MTIKLPLSVLSRRSSKSRLRQVARAHCLTLSLLCGCTAPSGLPPEPPEPTIPEPDWVVIEPLIIAAEPTTPFLDIGVVLFDAGVAAADDTPMAAVRRLEAVLLARDLKEVLVSSNHWGAVRLVPEASALTAVAVHTRILQSDGRDLLLAVQVRDSLGGVWLETTIAHRATLTDQVTYSSAEIFNGLSNEIGRIWLQTAPETRERLIAAADIVYAESLVPSAFSGMVSHSAEGWQLNRLPASDDPMVARVERVRNQEYLFCDTIDEQYALMAEQVGPTYEMWRQATLEQAEWLAQYEQRAAMREAKASDSQFSRMHAQYAAYRSFRIQEQAFFELAKALDNESEPTVLRTEDQVVRLEGTLSSQYDQWRGLLREIYALEQPPASW